MLYLGTRECAIVKTHSAIGGRKALGLCGVAKEQIFHLQRNRRNGLLHQLAVDVQTASAVLHRTGDGDQRILQGVKTVRHLGTGHVGGLLELQLVRRVPTEQSKVVVVAVHNRVEVNAQRLQILDLKLYRKGILIDGSVYLVGKIILDGVEMIAVLSKVVLLVNGYRHVVLSR